MGRKSRENIKVAFDAAYEPVGRIGDPCVYCGVASSGYDHVPPLHFVSRLDDRDRWAFDLRKLPACPECNSLLGGCLKTTIRERRAIIKAKLRSRYRCVLGMPAWDEDELDELGPSLRGNVRNHAKFSTYIKKRLGYGK
jgi:hypothetical protein